MTSSSKKLFFASTIVEEEEKAEVKAMKSAAVTTAINPEIYYN